MAQEWAEFLVEEVCLSNSGLTLDGLRLGENITSRWSNGELEESGKSSFLIPIFIYQKLYLIQFFSLIYIQSYVRQFLLERKLGLKEQTSRSKLPDFLAIKNLLNKVQIYICEI